MAKKKFNIPIFKAEREAGLAETIQANASIAYMTQLQDTKLSQDVARSILKHSFGSIDEDQFDLFYLTTILVTTGCNKNLDVFSKAPTWAARYTPIHKQFNLEHDQSKIIGHMTSAKVVNENFQPISDNITIDELPDKFHIMTGAVIYRTLADEEAQTKINKIIDEIGNGEWYVSMECLFRDFDYAVISGTGEQRVLPRTEETSWLTKYLRQYGGEGSYNGFTLGRVLKDITFSGKGLVRKPANPESIIFNENVVAFNATVASLGYINTSNDSNSTERVSMANENDSQVKDLEKKLEAALNEITTLRDQIKTHESSAVTAKVNALEADVTAKNERITQLEGELKTTNEVKATVETDLKTAENRALKAEEELKKVKADEQTRARVEKLTKLHAPEDEAKQIVALFADKDDAQFDTLVNLFASKWTVKEEPEVNHEALSTAEPEEDEATLATGGEDENVNNIRMAMASVLDQMVHGPDIEPQNGEQL